MSAVAAILPDGKRLHLQHGPIDLVIEAFGPPSERANAYRSAIETFETVLDGLVRLRPTLSKPVNKALPMGGATPSERIAQAMIRAAASVNRAFFVTPMAAVAGAVADEILRAMTAHANLERAYVNNGGDVAIFLAPGQTLTAAAGPDLAQRVTVRAKDGVRGLATSGWRGRSWSLGIADAVTVLARNAAQADLAATLIANAIDLPGHPAIDRTPCCALDPDSDLGERLVTRSVGQLDTTEVSAALQAGLQSAETFVAAGEITAAALWLGGACITCGHTNLINKELTHA